jgi:DNA mismatch repair protein MutL
VTFNSLMSRRGETAPHTQRLAMPILLETGPSETANLLASREMLGSFGFEIEPFGEDAVRVSAVPAEFPPSLTEEILRSFAGDDGAARQAPEVIALAISRWACKDSVTAGRRLTGTEMARLVEDLSRAEVGFSCPHGRPTRITLTRVELEKLFKRR